MSVSSPYALFRAVDLGWPPPPLPATDLSQTRSPLGEQSVTTRYNQNGDLRSPSPDPRRFPAPHASNLEWGGDRHQ